jgi:GTPase SAR1 family protein
VHEKRDLACSARAQNLCFELMTLTLLILGAPKTGKTALANRLHHDKFVKLPSRVVGDEERHDFSVEIPERKTPVVAVRLIDASGEKDVVRNKWKSWLAEVSLKIVNLFVNLN